MNHVKRPLLNNLMILLAYTAVSGLLTSRSSDHKGLGAMMLIAMLVGLHNLILLTISIVKFIRYDKPGGKAYLLSALLVLLIGFSACYGVGALLSR